MTNKPAVVRVPVQTAVVVSLPDGPVTIETGGQGAAGPQGATGPGGAMTGPVSSVDGQIVVFDGTSGTAVKAGATTEKTTPLDADRLPLIDTAASNVVKWLSLTNLWVWAKAKADALYQAKDAQLSSLVRQRALTSDVVLALVDSGYHFYRPTSDTTPRGVTVPANGTVPFEIGTIVTIDNDGGSGSVTITVTSDTMSLVGLGRLTGARTLAVGGQATLLKVATTRWRIWGTGLT